MDVGPPSWGWRRFGSDLGPSGPGPGLGLDLHDLSLLFSCLRRSRRVHLDLDKYIFNSLFAGAGSEDLEGRGCHAGLRVTDSGD